MAATRQAARLAGYAKDEKHLDRIDLKIQQENVTIQLGSRQGNKSYCCEYTFNESLRLNMSI